MDRPIRLAHVFSSDLGIEASMPYIEPLLDRGWEVTAISPEGPRVAAAEARGVRWKPLAIRRAFDLAGDAAGSIQLLSYLLRDRYDIVHTHNIKVGLIARVLSTVARVPTLVHTLHGLAYSLETPQPKRALHAALERIANLRVDAVLAQSQGDRDTVVETGAVAADRVFVIGNGIDLDCFDPERFNEEERNRIRVEIGVSADEVLFLSAGRLVREKGYVELFRAAAAARRSDARVRLCVAGRPDNDRGDSIGEDELRTARADGVLLLGERHDMPRLYAAADIVILASWREGIPRVLMEGAAMGKPLIATDIRGCREVVRPPTNGALVPPRDSLAIAEAMCRMAADPALRRRQADFARAEARDRYDVARVVGRVVEVYCNLLLQRGSAP